MSTDRSILVSIVVLSWNNPDDLKECISSILEGDISVPWELIVVDNGSTRETQDYLNHLYDTQHDSINLKIVRNAYNMGFAAGNNQAIPHVEGKYTLFLNDDIVITSGSVEALAAVLEEDSHHIYGTVAPQLRYFDGKIQHTCRRLPTPQLMLSYYVRMSWDDSHVYDHEKSGEREQAMAAALMIRTELLKRIGGFNESPGMWIFFNDVDLSKEVQAAGYKGYYTVAQFMYHGHGQSTQKFMKMNKVWLWHRGLFAYFDKWYVDNTFEKLVLSGLVGISLVGLATREQLRRLKG